MSPTGDQLWKRVARAIDWLGGIPIGAHIGTLDTMIAAHALSQRSLLVTHNTREFAQVSGLQLANWTTAA